MSKSIITATAFAVGLASLLAQGSAMAGPVCNGSVQKLERGTTQCYYLPTVANGRVTGLEKHENFKVNHYVPNHAAPHQAGGPMPCRFLPTVINGRVTGSHQVCG
jgi:hypothetical protein